MGVMCECAFESRSRRQRMGGSEMMTWIQRIQGNRPRQDCPAAAEESVFQHRFILFDRTWPEMIIRREDARAGIPAENRLVVAARANGLRLLVPLHRLVKRVVGHGSRAGC